MALWGIKIRTEKAYHLFHLGWSFEVAVAHEILALIGGIVASLAAFKTEFQYLLLEPEQTIDVQIHRKTVKINIA